MSERDRDDREVARWVAAWKASSPAPPDDLEDRIVRAVRAEHEAATGTRRRHEDVADARPAGPARWWKPTTWPAPAWAAAGALATVLLVAGLMVVRATIAPIAPIEADRLLVADALREAEAAERQHARAIARLQEAARPILAKARDPQVPSEQAARLIMLGNRLRFLDQTIAEIESFVQDNPAHPGTRATLLAAYVEKTTVLRSIIALDEEISS